MVLIRGFYWVEQEFCADIAFYDMDMYRLVIIGVKEEPESE